MTQGTPSPRGHTLAEVADAAAALAALDTAVDALKTIAAWSKDELDLLRSDEADDREALLRSWESLATTLAAAVADLEAANRRLDGLTRIVVRDLVAGGTIVRAMTPPDGENH